MGNFVKDIGNSITSNPIVSGIVGGAIGGPVGAVAGYSYSKSKQDKKNNNSSQDWVKQQSADMAGMAGRQEAARNKFYQDVGFKDSYEPANAYQQYFANLQKQTTMPSIEASNIRNQGLANARALQASGLSGGALARAKIEAGKSIASQAGKAEDMQKQGAYDNLGAAAGTALQSAYQQANASEALRQAYRMPVAADPKKGILSGFFDTLF